MKPPRKAFTKGDTVLLDTTSPTGVHVHEKTVTDTRFEDGYWKYELDGEIERERCALRRPESRGNYALL